MRWSILILLMMAGPAVAADQQELVTAPDAVLCLRADSLDAAAARQGARSQERLRALGCLRSPAGVAATLLSNPVGASTWSVRYRPDGISDGITLWGRPSAFTRPDGTALPTVKAER